MSDDDTGRRLREAREYLMLESEFVAVETGISEAELSNIEQGCQAPSELQLRRLSHLYDYPVSFFVGDDQPFDEERVAFLARWAEGLSDEDRDEAIRFARYLHFAGQMDG